MTRVALLGATSHIAKGLICRLAKLDGWQLFLFARSPVSAKEFLSTWGMADQGCAVADFSVFASGQYDVVINCVGLGNPQKLRDSLGGIFRITEEFDNLIIDYLQAHPETKYINFSSGAAYGLNFSRPADESSPGCFALNRLSPEEYYGIAKLHSEAKHRALGNSNIVDLRVFSYFSRFIDLKEKFLMSDIVRAILVGEELVTGSGNIVRDYVHPDDLAALILLCCQQESLNGVFDVYSAQPVTKFEVLEKFRVGFGLRYRVDENFKNFTVTGMKNDYYSTNKLAAQIGYQPKFFSIETLVSETEAIINMQSLRVR